MEDSASQLPKIRHSLAHVLAEAILEIRPDSQLAFGPPIDTGCYYDFLFSTPLSPDDFRDIEKRMRKIIGRREKFEHTSRSAEEAVAYLEERGQGFKVEYCRELISQGECEIGFYKNGPFEDMCAGPHVEHTGQIPPDCFRIDSLAGAYWRGSEKNPQLTRVYCLAFENKAALEEFVQKRELAKERDHRKLGKELDLFVISDHVGPGLPLWTPNGTAIKDALEDYAKEVEALHGYVRVSTPHIAKEELYQLSGHLPYYQDSMFPPMHAENEATYYLKAMNCPHHHMIYSHRPRSYRELPLRFAEYGTVYRFEASGTLSGLLRVRSIAQNDAHIYCTEEQLEQELIDTFNLTVQYYERFRFQNVKARFSTHDPANGSKFVDNPELWKFSEDVVSRVFSKVGVPFVEGFGEAAFYGPKIDFQATTLTGREESLATTQLDFAQPLRFNLTYVGADGSEHRPFVVHRAPLGSHERTLAFLIEHFGGAFPTWMAPCQVQIIPVNEGCHEYALQLRDALRARLIRAQVDLSSHSFNKKIREGVTSKAPTLAIIGNNEVESNSVTLRRYCRKDQSSVDRDQFISRVERNIRERVMDNFADVEF